VTPQSVITHAFATLFYFSHLRWDDDDDDDDNDNDNEDDDNDNNNNNNNNLYFFLVIHNGKQYQYLLSSQEEK
jgi:hypothetical protein